VEKDLEPFLVLVEFFELGFVGCEVVDKFEVVDETFVNISLLVTNVVGFNIVDETWVVEIFSKTVLISVELLKLVVVRCEVVDDFKVVNGTYMDVLLFVSIVDGFFDVDEIWVVDMVLVTVLIPVVDDFKVVNATFMDDLFFVAVLNGFVVVDEIWVVDMVPETVLKPVELLELVVAG
jgi:hypothetical protein